MAPQWHCQWSYVCDASDPNRHDYFKSIVKHLMDLYSKGKIRPVIDSTWAFEDVRHVVTRSYCSQH